MFTLNLDALVLNLDGSPALVNRQTLNIRLCLLNSLTSLTEDDAGDSVTEKLARVALAERVQTSTMLELTLPEVLMVVPLIKRTFPHPLVLATVIKLLEDSVTPQ